MPKGENDALTIRIKSSFTKFIKAEAKRLDLSPTKTVYHILSVYRHSIANQLVNNSQSYLQALTESEVKDSSVQPKNDDEEFEVKSNLLDEDTVQDNFNDFAVDS